MSLLLRVVFALFFFSIIKFIDITPILAEDNTDYAYELLMSNYKKVFMLMFMSYL